MAIFWIMLSMREPERRDAALALPHQVWHIASQIDYRAHLQSTSAAIQHQFYMVFQTDANFLSVIEGKLISREHQGRTQQRFIQLSEQRVHHRMIANPHPDGAAPGMLQATRHLPRSRKYKSIRTGCTRLEQSVFAVIELGITGDFGEISAHQRKMMMLIHLADRANSRHDGLVTQVAPQGIA